MASWCCIVFGGLAIGDQLGICIFPCKSPSVLHVHGSVFGARGGGGLWLGRVLFSTQKSGKGTFFTVSVWEGCTLFSGPTVWQGVCFDPGLIPKVWQGSHFHLFFLGRMGIFCLGRVRVCHPGLHTPMHNLVKSPPPPGRLAQDVMTKSNRSESLPIELTVEMAIPRTWPYWNRSLSDSVTI